MSASAKRAKSKRRLSNPEGKGIPQQATGLWIDYDLLRRHMNPLPKFVSIAEPDDRHDISRYLKLADALLQEK